MARGRGKGERLVAAKGLLEFLGSAGMALQGYDLSLTRYDERGWRATFYVSGMEYAATGATGSAFEPAPWLAVQRAAWETLQAVVI